MASDGVRAVTFHPQRRSRPLSRNRSCSADAIGGASENVKYHLKSVQYHIIHAPWGPLSGFPTTITGPRGCGNVIADEKLQRGPVIVMVKPLSGPQEAWLMSVCTLFGRYFTFFDAPRWGPRCNFSSATAVATAVAEQKMQRGPVIAIGQPLWGPRRACTMSLSTLWSEEL